MATRARRSTADEAHRTFDVEERFAHDELWPGERIGPLPSRSGGKVLLRGLIILITFGGGWALLSDPASWPRWQSIETAASFWLSSGAPEKVKPAALAMAISPPPTRTDPPAKPVALAQPPPIAELPVASKGSEAPPMTTAALPSAATGSGEPAAPPLPPPTADPADPYQMRAAAVGLHPDLSRVLLERLSSTDYRNAAIAIQTAMAETPDSAVFVWPRQRKPELALFQVRFVPGAAPGCRRYVVTVTKDGWLTTALPMEKCAPQAARTRHQ
jgi:hypothetical protein